jgi:hypothetical protein
MEAMRQVLPDGDPLPNTEETNEVVWEWLERQPFRAARVPEAHAHEYLLMDKADDPVFQLRVVDLIRRTGRTETFQGIAYAYREWGGRLYWASAPLTRFSPPDRGVTDSVLNRRAADMAPEEDPTLWD